MLSHSKPFLLSVAEGVPSDRVSSIEIVRGMHGSNLEVWDLSEESMTDYDRRYAAFDTFLSEGKGDRQGIARDIRLHLEGYLRVVCAKQFHPGDVLGHQFISKCEGSLSTPNPVMDQQKLIELKELHEYARRFHHETNPDWRNQQISDAELKTFVERTLRFTSL